MALWGEVIGEIECCTYAFGTSYDVRYVVLPFDIGLYNMSNGDFLISGLLLSQTLLQTFLWSLIIISSIWLLFGTRGTIRKDRKCIECGRRTWSDSQKKCYSCTPSRKEDSNRSAGNQIKSDKKKRSPKKISKKKKSSKPLESEKMRNIRNLRKMILENKDDPNRLVFMEEQIISMLEAVKTSGAADIEENSDVIAGFEELLDLVKKYK